MYVVQVFLAGDRQPKTPIDIKKIVNVPTYGNF